MKHFDWDEDKNGRLKLERGIGFEEVQSAIVEGNLIDLIDHPNQITYPKQKIFILEVKNYVYMVPFIEDEEKVFLKTIFPSRKETKKYLKGGKLR